MENRCGFCDKKSLSLRRCSGCQQVQYCSTVCQREDWKGQHKVKCKEFQKSRGEADKTAEAEAVPPKQQRPDDGNNENRTGRTVYPADSKYGVNYDMIQSFAKVNEKVYFTDNLSASQILCDSKLPNKNANGTSRNADSFCENRTCVVCGKADITVKACGGCKMANYCSKNCQRHHWKVHKIQCNNPNEDVDEIITTDGYRREEKFASSTAPGNKSWRSVPRAADLSYRAHSRSGGIEHAKSLTWKVFPGCTILDYVREIPHEMYGRRPRGTSKVAVGFISRFHDYVMRHCIYFQDKDGDEVYVGFYLINDDPSPYFRWDDVVPGRYICIEDPYIHLYLDGSIGIRVDVASSVRVFSI